MRNWRHLVCASCGSDAGENSRYCGACGSTVIRAADPDDYVGKTIAKKFRVECMLGEGGMGRVYRAKQIALDKPVVLKILRRSLLSDERTVARFQREARAASRLNHANSISVLDFGQSDDGALYIAMELVSGKDLHQILSEEWPLPEARLIRIIAQVLSALADAHNAGVIHRDLKPENIMVEQRRGEPDFVKVLDFGIAKIMDVAGEEPALTRAGFVCGTPEYMSPEQARGATLDPRSDLYAVGVILYQLTSGLLPFDADSAVGFATKHLSDEPLPPTRRRPQAKISVPMEQLIMKALAKDPAHRPQTAEAFREELLAIQGWRPVPASRRTVNFESPPRVVEPDEKKIKRHRKPLVLGMVLCAVVLALVFFSGPKEPRVRRSPTKQHAYAPRGLYELQVPGAQRDVPGAAALLGQADEAHARGNLSEAEEKYREAFRKNPSPEASLKLGELLFQAGRNEEAKGFWLRHLRDRQQSKARRYIEQALGERLEPSN